MDYVEKELPGKPITENTSDSSIFEKLAKLPRFFIKFLLKRNIEKIRAGMGGDSKDITTQKIMVRDENIPGYKSQIRVRIYSPESSKIRSLVVFFHGGGWIGGSLAAVEEFCKGVSDQADCVVMSVEYHLAPEHPFPEGLEDSYSAIKWALSDKEKLKFDPNQIIVAGDSAGGNFATVLCLMARERREFSLAKQILIYPATNLIEEVNINKDLKSIYPPAAIKILGIMMDLYFKGKVDKLNPLISPVYAKDLSKLPPALIIVGDKDFLHESSLLYAKKLEATGNKVRFILYKNAYHAFIDDTGTSEQANDLVHEVANFIRN